MLHAAPIYMYFPRLKFSSCHILLLVQVPSHEISYVGKLESVHIYDTQLFYSVIRVAFKMRKHAHNHVKLFNEWLIPALIDPHQNVQVYRQR